MMKIDERFDTLNIKIESQNVQIKSLQSDVKVSNFLLNYNRSNPHLYFFFVEFANRSLCIANL